MGENLKGIFKEVFYQIGLPTLIVSHDLKEIKAVNDQFLYYFGQSPESINHEELLDFLMLDKILCPITLHIDFSKHPNPKLSQHPPFLSIVSLKNESVYCLFASCDHQERQKREFANKEMEHHLILKDKMASIGELASSIGHELNNPLTILKGFNSLLSDEASKLPASEQTSQIKSFIETQEKSIARMISLVRSLRIYSKDHEEDLTIFNIVHIFNAGISLIENIYSKEKISILHNKPSEELLVKGNPGLFQQCLLNFLSISKKSILEKGLKEAQIIISYEKLENNLLFKIKHNGKSIPNKHFEDWHFLFTPEEINDDKILSLHFSMTMIKKMKGSLTIESNDSEGTCFILGLPLIKK